jgi:hypothetical protein
MSEHAKMVASLEVRLSVFSLPKKLQLNFSAHLWQEIAAAGKALDLATMCSSARPAPSPPHQHFLLAVS